VDHGDSIEGVHDNYWFLRAEVVSEEELAALESPGSKLVHAYHFHYDTTTQCSTNFGEPFLLPIAEEETCAQIKTRIQVKGLEEDAVGQNVPLFLQDSAHCGFGLAFVWLPSGAWPCCHWKPPFSFEAGVVVSAASHGVHLSLLWHLSSSKQLLVVSCNVSQDQNGCMGNA
jgi:Ubiquitin-specific protease C-terminal